MDDEFAEYFTARVAGCRRLAYALSGDWHTAEDLVQASFIKLYRHWRRVRTGTTDAYLRKIVVNTFLSHRRRYRREASVPDVPDRAAPAANGQGVDVDLGRALAALPPRQRAMVALRFLDDMSVIEVAELLGVAEGTVKSQTARGLHSLRVALDAPTLIERS